MAEAALALQESPDTKRFQRVVTLLVRGGTIIIRGLFDDIHPPSTLVHVLQIQHRATLDDLKKRRILNSDQWKKLFPSPGAYGQSKDFDLTLLFVLLRNICNLTAPANGWDKLPAHISDITREDDLARIKYYRNFTYAHTLDGKLSEDEFNEYWDEISHALVRILTVYDTQESVRNWEKEIKKLRRGPISSEDTQKWLDGLPKMVIVASISFGVGAVAGPPLFNLLKDNIPWPDLIQNVQKVISQSGGIMVENIYNGSVLIQLCVKDLKELENLWKSYKNGQLKSELQKVLIPSDIKELDIKNVELEVTMSEDEYLDASSFFEEIISSQKPIKGKSVEIKEVKEMTERLKELSLDIQHGDIIIDRGSHFQAHFSEVTSKDQIDKVVGHIKKEYADATNVVWASKLYDSDKDTIIYESDDGDEYLAGRRLQVLLEKIKVNNIVVIATCWQGEEYLYRDIYKHINERVLSLLMRHGLIETKSPEKLAKSLRKLEDIFQKWKQKLAYAAYEMKQAAPEPPPTTEFDFIHSEVIADRKSKFQAHLAKVTSQEQVEQALAQLKTDGKIAKATYNMLAYRIYVKEKKSYLEEGRDDGENEAGRRLLHLLQISKVKDVVVIVTRWHGGVHIGPDRFKHINECANEVIKIATEQGIIETVVESSELSGTKKKGKGKGKK